jgi:hypothetical protein
LVETPFYGLLGMFVKQVFLKLKTSLLKYKPLRAKNAGGWMIVDNETRGLIENMLDEAVKNLSKKSSLRGIVDWFMEDIVNELLEDFRKEITSCQDFTLGYILGYLAHSSHAIVIDRKYWKNVDEEWAKKYGQRLLKEKKANEKKLGFRRLTKSEQIEIRNMLRQRVSRIKEEIIKGINV